MKRYDEFINEKVNWNQSLIYYADHGNLKGVERAINNGADIHFNNDYALLSASWNGYLKIVKYLIEHGADIHSDNDKALQGAIFWGRLKVVIYLCEYIIQNEPWYIPKIMEYIPDELKEKYPHLFAASDMDLL